MAQRQGGPGSGWHREVAVTLHLGAGSEGRKSFIKVVMTEPDVMELSRLHRAGADGFWRFPHGQDLAHLLLADVRAVSWAPHSVDCPGQQT